MAGQVEAQWTRARVLSKRFSMKAVIAEFLATLLLTHLGTAAIIGMGATLHLTPSEALVGTALAFGVSYTVVLYITKHISGGQANPAVTVALFFSGYLPVWQMLANIAAQCLGALVGSLVLLALIPHSMRETSNMGINTLPHHSPFNTVLRAFLAEVVGTFLVTLVYLETRFNVKSKAADAFPVAVGFAVFLSTLVFAPISTGSFNPARSFGPAVVAMNFRYLWLYIVGPIVGALLAAPLHALFVSDWDTLSEDVAGPYVYEFEHTQREPLLATTVVHEGNLE